MPPEVWVIIPAFNEEKVIASVLEEFRSLPYQVVVVDDGSLDGTHRVALRFPVTVLRHMINLGQGAALRTGLRYVLQQAQARYIVTFDADGQHHASDIGEMLALSQSGKYDVVLGSRFLPGHHPENMPFLRRLVLKLAVLFTRLTTGLPLTDAHNGLRLFTFPAAARLHLRQNGMAHASEILTQVAQLKLRWCEAPVTITYTEYSRRKGQSVWNSFNILWDILMGRFK